MPFLARIKWAGKVQIDESRLRREMGTEPRLPGLESGDRQDYVPKHLKSRNAGDALLGGDDRARNATLVVNKR